MPRLSRYSPVATLLIAAGAVLLSALPALATPKVLLVVSGEGREENGKIVRPGFEMDELALAWLTLRANGLQLEIASPQGGAVIADRYNAKDDHNAAFLADADGRSALAATRRTADVKPGEHAAIFVIGGKGAMFDLPRDAALIALLQAQQRLNGVIAAVCHGPAVLAKVQTADGKPLLAGRRVTGFTDEEETLFGKRWAQEYPFWIERKAREQGALWQEAPLMMPKLVVDGRLVTGQNPFSTTAVAEAIVEQLGRRPAARTEYLEERTMKLVQRWLAGERDSVRAVLAQQPPTVKTDLIAMLGYYQFEAAADDEARRQALAVMEMAEPHMQHPQFRLGLAKAYAQQAQPQRATQILQALLAADKLEAGLRDQAQALLSQLRG